MCMMSGWISASCVALEISKVQFYNEIIIYDNEFDLFVSSCSFFRSLTFKIRFLKICQNHC